MDLRERVIALAQRHRRYGVGMIHLKLRQAGELVNYKRVERLYTLEKLCRFGAAGRHTAEFKAEMVAACRRPGASSAAVAQAHSINVNLLRRWVSEAERAEGRTTKSSEPVTPAPEAFIALPAPSRPVPDASIQIQVRPGTTTVTVQCP